jgi:hypothetical protein
MITLTSDELKHLKEYTSGTSADRIELLMMTAHSFFPEATPEQKLEFCKRIRQVVMDCWSEFDKRV